MVGQGRVTAIDRIVIEVDDTEDKLKLDVRRAIEVSVFGSYHSRAEGLSMSQSAYVRLVAEQFALVRNKQEELVRRGIQGKPLSDQVGC